MSFVCVVDGVEVTNSKSGRLVHIGEIPKGIDPDHEINAVERERFDRVLGAKFDLKAAAEEMLLHHATLHPADGCEWHERLERALRSA